MTIHDATEVAYKNGYAAGKRDAMKWIPVTERLPNGWHTVIVMRKHGLVDFDNYIGFLGIWNKKRNKRLPVTHWMKLPEPPKEDA